MRHADQLEKIGQHASLWYTLWARLHVLRDISWDPFFVRLFNKNLFDHVYRKRSPQNTFCGESPRRVMAKYGDKVSAPLIHHGQVLPCARIVICYLDGIRRFHTDPNGTRTEQIFVRAKSSASNKRLSIGSCNRARFPCETGALPQDPSTGDKL